MRLLADKHIQYIQSLDQFSISSHRHLRINGVYWGLTSTLLLDRPGGLPRQEMIDWVMSCWEPDSGGFRPHPGHDPHIHSTLSAIQILTMQDSLHVIDKPKVMNCLALLGGLDKLDRDAVIGFISRCQNFDGGFGMVEGAESHAAYVWTCVGTLAILDRLDIVDANTLGWWLSERQVPNGGLNGRPEKLEDVCYSWWALASLVIIGKSEWIDRSKLTSSYYHDPDSGGIADRPDDMPDVWHTVFGLAGLSMLGYEGLKPVDPVFCMPAQFTKGLVKVTS
ncbi:hypothetical protein PSTT_15117 [Puccinia striiformis]|uniref:Geranylgeranyl transferase type-2 subunit beta n=1 Tax=Puccinia striiformis TaxID=27350 RepID=A0A2S4UJ83_9BASI|nr:hypothetical protein PSTT_15117 [Puccinia striiformis]